MKDQEVEVWARDVIDAVMANQPVEDTRVELKSSWPEPRKAADRLAAHATIRLGFSLAGTIIESEASRGHDERQAKAE